MLVWDTKALIQKATHPRDPRGSEAIADYRTVERFRDAALIEVQLRTGRRNQIRVQAKLRGHTLVGEERYVYGTEALRPIPFGRQALHAYRIGFVHPLEDRDVQIEVPPPADFQDLLQPAASSAGVSLKPIRVNTLRASQPPPSTGARPCLTARPAASSPRVCLRL